MRVVFTSRRFEDSNHSQDHNCLCEDKYSSCEVCAVEKDRAQSGTEGCKVKCQGGLRVGESSSFQAMGKVLSVADEGTFALTDAEECYAEKIVDGDSHYDKGHEDGV